MGFLTFLLETILNAKKDPDAWMETATKAELYDAYEEERLEWAKNGGGEKTQKMKRLDKEISKRAAEEWQNDPRRSKDPNYRWTDANRWDKD